jgi:hypothetical protein
MGHGEGRGDEMVKDWDDMSDEEKAAAVIKWRREGTVVRRDLATYIEPWMKVKKKGGRKGRMG